MNDSQVDQVLITRKRVWGSSSAAAGCFDDRRSFAVVWLMTWWELIWCITPTFKVFFVGCWLYPASWDLTIIRPAYPTILASQASTEKVMSLFSNFLLYTWLLGTVWCDYPWLARLAQTRVENEILPKCANFKYLMQRMFEFIAVYIHTWLLGQLSNQIRYFINFFCS